MGLGRFHIEQIQLRLNFKNYHRHHHHQCTIGLVTCSNSELLLKLWIISIFARTPLEGLSRTQGLRLHRTAQRRKTRTNIHASFFFMSMVWDNVSELRLPADLLFIPLVIYEHGDPWWNDIDRGNRRHWRETCPSATQTDPGKNPGLHGETLTMAVINSRIPQQEL
jgi:hypothetical protein